jgi:hypothetical protein
MIINQENIALNVLPPSKRYNIVTGVVFDKWIAWFKGLASQMVWLHDIYKLYTDGSYSYPYWSAGIYNKGDRVNSVYGVYESTEDANSNIPTGSGWMKLTPSFIGSSERVLYSGMRIRLEYALNKQFGNELVINGYSGFKQPVSYSGSGQLPLSDIYITASPPAYVSFAFSNSSQIEGGISTVSSINGIANVTINTIASSYQFKIYIPAPVYLSIGPEAEKIIRGFVDRYIMIGVGYSIIQY